MREANDLINWRLERTQVDGFGPASVNSAHAIYCGAGQLGSPQVKSQYQ
jgi:hypothetical protein